MTSKGTTKNTKTGRVATAAEPKTPAAVAVFEDAIGELRAWLVRGHATRGAAWSASSAEGMGEPDAIRLTDLSAQLGMLLEVVGAALGAADLGRTEDDQRVRTSVRPARQVGTMVEPASVTLTFGVAYQVSPHLEPLGDEPGRWRKLARLSHDFAGYAWTWQRVGHPAITEEELDALADRVMARETWPRLDELREMFRDVDRTRRAVGGAVIQ